MDKNITHNAYVWLDNFNKYKINLLKNKTEEQHEEIINKIRGDTDEIIEKLKTVIDENIRKDIDSEDNPKRCFLIIGGDEDLTEGIVSYIFCYYLFTKGKLFFCSNNFTGNDDRTIKEKLINQSSGNTFIRESIYEPSKSGYQDLIDLMDRIERDRSNLLLYFQYGGTLFLRNLKSQDHEMLRCIAVKIRDIVTKNNDSCGILIVSTDNKDNLSDYFKAQFETINLDLELKKDGKTIESTQPQPSSQHIQPELKSEMHDILACIPQNESDKQKTNISEAKQAITKLFYDDGKAILFSENGEYCELTKDEQVLVDYLKKDKNHVEDIIGHFQTHKEYSSNDWIRNNFEVLKSKLNKKSQSKFCLELIKNTEKGSGEYGISVKIKDMKFKK